MKYFIIVNLVLKIYKSSNLFLLKYFFVKKECNLILIMQILLDNNFISENLEKVLFIIFIFATVIAIQYFIIMHFIDSIKY